MAEWKPLITSLMIIMLVGAGIPYLVSAFVDEGDYNHDSYVDPVINFIEDGISWKPGNPIIGLFVDEININPFVIAGEDVRSFLVTQIIAFSFIPPVLAIPMLIIVFVAFVWSLLTLVRGN